MTGSKHRIIKEKKKAQRVGGGREESKKGSGGEMKRLRGGREDGWRDAQEVVRLKKILSVRSIPSRTG